MAKFRDFERIFQNFPKFGAKDSCDFSGFDTFSAFFRNAENAALAVKFGVDTADILLF